MSTGIARHVEDTIGELSGLTDTPVNDGEGRIFVDIVRIEYKVLDANVEIDS